MPKHDVIHRTGSIYNIALSSEEDRATAAGNVNIYRKLGEAWNAVLSF